MIVELLNKGVQITDRGCSLFQTRHQRGDTHPLTLEEILDETQHLDIGLKQKQWLMSEVKKSLDFNKRSKDNDKPEPYRFI